MALELALWGADAATLPWLTPPPAASLATARALLSDLGALAADGTITPHGRAMARLGQHPRLAHLVLKGRTLGQGRVAALLAAILGERDFLRPATGTARRRPAPSRRHRAGQRARRSARRHAAPDPGAGAPADAARRRSRDARRGDDRPTACPRLSRPHRPPAAGDHRYLLSGGRGAALPEGDPMANEEFLVVAISTARPRIRASSSPRDHAGRYRNAVRRSYRPRRHRALERARRRRAGAPAPPAGRTGAGGQAAGAARRRGIARGHDRRHQAGRPRQPAVVGRPREVA